MYEFVVNEMVPRLNLKLAGVFNAGVLTGCMIYTTPESYEWNNNMNVAIGEMREKSGNERIRMIGEYATLVGYDPGVRHFYCNELAVKKEYRNKGLGKALCQFLINECGKSNEAKGIMIDTANERNMTLYEKMGWELKATVPFYDINKYFLWRNS